MKLGLALFWGYFLNWFIFLNWNLHLSLNWLCIVHCFIYSASNIVTFLSDITDLFCSVGGFLSHEDHLSVSTNRHSYLKMLSVCLLWVFLVASCALIPVASIPLSNRAQSLSFPPRDGDVWGIGEDRPTPKFDEEWSCLSAPNTWRKARIRNCFRTWARTNFMTFLTRSVQKRP